MTSTNNAPAATPEVANLRETKREQAAARKRHPAGQAAAAKVTAAKAASAKLAESMAAKPAKAPAKQPAKKAAPVPAGSKLRWTHEGGERGNHTAQHATAADGTVYEMTSAGSEWTATVTPPGGKPVVLAAGVSGGKAYAVCVRHHREALAA
jgi:hypothetical protein